MDERVDLLVTVVLAADDERAARQACQELQWNVDGRIVESADCSAEEPGCWSVTMRVPTEERAVHNVAAPLARAVRQFVRNLGPAFDTPRVACEPPTAWTVVDDPEALDELVSGAERLFVEAWCGGDPYPPASDEPDPLWPEDTGEVGDRNPADAPAPEHAETSRAEHVETSGAEPDDVPGPEPADPSRTERGPEPGTATDLWRTPEQVATEPGTAPAPEPPGRHAATGTATGTATRTEAGTEAATRTATQPETEAAARTAAEAGPTADPAAEHGRPDQGFDAPTTAGAPLATAPQRADNPPGAQESPGRSSPSASGPSRLRLRVDVATDRPSGAEWQARALASRLSRSATLTEITEANGVVSVHMDLGGTAAPPARAVLTAVSGLDRQGWSALRWAGETAITSWTAEPRPVAGITALELSSGPENHNRKH